jgi:hypothetical protein
MTFAQGHLVFAPGAHGYEILERETEPPSVGTEIELGGHRYVVAKIGPSPFPEDGRPCAYLQHSG